MNSKISNQFDRVCEKRNIPILSMKNYNVRTTERICSNKGTINIIEYKRKFFLFKCLRAITIDLLIIIFQNLKTFITNLYRFLKCSKNQQKKLIDFEKNQQNKSIDSEKNQQTVDTEKNQQTVDTEKNQQNKPIKYGESVCGTEVKQTQTSISETGRGIAEK